MPGFRALGVFFFSLMLIHWIGNNTMPRILSQAASLGSVASRGTSGLFRRVGKG
jgi:hypothetical protein